MTKETDYFEPTDGGFDSGAATVQDAWFEHDDERDRVLLKLAIYSEDPDVGEDTWQYGVGKGWEVKDDGARITHESGKLKKFHAKSGLGKLLRSANQNGVDLRTRGYTPFEAGLWKGLDAEWEAQSDTFTNDEGEEIRWNTIVLAGTSTNGNGAKTPAAATTPTDTTSALNGALRGKLTNLASTCSTHDEFMERAFVEVDGVAGDAAAEAAVMDANGIYAEAK